MARNRSKRRMRALFHDYCDLLQDGAYIFVAKSPMPTVQYSVLKQECRKALMRTGSFKDDKKNTP